MTGIHNLLEKMTTNFASTSPQTQNNFSTCEQFPKTSHLGIRSGPRISKTDLGHDQSRPAPSGHLLSMTDSPVSSVLKPSVCNDKHTNFSSASYHKKW